MGSQHLHKLSAFIRLWLFNLHCLLCKSSRSCATLWSCILLDLLAKFRTMPPVRARSFLAGSRPMVNFRDRVQSFSRGDFEHIFRNLAGAGFQFRASLDVAGCRFCNVTLCNYLAPVDPYIVHAKKNRRCKYLRKKMGDLWVDNAFRNYYRDYEDMLFQCSICTLGKIVGVLNPCRHAVVCELCMFNLTHCPRCQLEVTSIQKIYC